MSIVRFIFSPVIVIGVVFSGIVALPFILFISLYDTYASVYEYFSKKDIPILLNLFLTVISGSILFPFKIIGIHVPLLFRFAITAVLDGFIAFCISLGAAFTNPKDELMENRAVTSYKEQLILQISLRVGSLHVLQRLIHKAETILKNPAITDNSRYIIYRLEKMKQRIRPWKIESLIAQEVSLPTGLSELEAYYSELVDEDELFFSLYKNELRKEILLSLEKQAVFLKEQNSRRALEELIQSQGIDKTNLKPYILTREELILLKEKAKTNLNCENLLKRYERSHIYIEFRNPVTIEDEKDTGIYWIFEKKSLLQMWSDKGKCLEHPETRKPLENYTIYSGYTCKFSKHFEGLHKKIQSVLRASAPEAQSIQSNATLFCSPTQLIDEIKNTEASEQADQPGHPDFDKSRIPTVEPILPLNQSPSINCQ